MKRNIITGQKVSPEKKARSRELRKNMTLAEKMLWEYLRAKRFNNFKFRRQQVIAGFIVDFYCHALELIIEVDGKIHDKQQEYDRHRENIFMNKGFHIIRFTNKQVINDIETVLKTIADKAEDIEDLQDLRQARKEAAVEPYLSLEVVKKILDI